MNCPGWVSQKDACPQPPIPHHPPSPRSPACSSFPQGQEHQRALLTSRLQVTDCDEPGKCHNWSGDQYIDSFAGVTTNWDMIGGAHVSLAQNFWLDAALHKCWSMRFIFSAGACSAEELYTFSIMFCALGMRGVRENWMPCVVYSWGRVEGVNLGSPPSAAQNKRLDAVPQPCALHCRLKTRSTLTVSLKVVPSLLLPCTNLSLSLASRILPSTPYTLSRKGV